jgi:two-component sensor histidine kinase
VAELYSNGNNTVIGPGIVMKVMAGNSFGMILMRGMAEDLEGNFTIASGPGTTITVSFINSKP